VQLLTDDVSQLVPEKPGLHSWQVSDSFWLESLNDLHLSFFKGHAWEESNCRRNNPSSFWHCWHVPFEFRIWQFVAWHVSLSGDGSNPLTHATHSPEDKSISSQFFINFSHLLSCPSV
jgi:hypothetical protein